MAKLKDTHRATPSPGGSVRSDCPRWNFRRRGDLGRDGQQRREEDKLAAGLTSCTRKDPTFHFEYNSELGQTLIQGMGERHWRFCWGRLARKYGVHAELTRPRVAYRENVPRVAEGQGTHKKQRRTGTVRRRPRADFAAGRGMAMSSWTALWAE